MSNRDCLRSASSRSSKSSTAERQSSASGNSKQKVTGLKPQLAKKRPPLNDLTNGTKNGSQIGSRVVSIQSKPLVSCSAKITKKTEASTRAFAKGLPVNTFSKLSCAKLDAHVPSKRKVTPISDRPTCNSLKSPEFEYKQNDDASAVQSTERNNSFLKITDHAQSPGTICKGDSLVAVETVDNFVDIDANIEEPRFCATFACEIYKHLRESEVKRRPSMDYMERVQIDIRANMRGILVDWLVEVAEEYNLVSETLFLTVNYVDRYLSCKVITRHQLQLLGATCMMIAAKYEEICPPQVDEFSYITNNTYSKEKVLRMETAVLNRLKFEMTAPTTNSFVRRFVRIAQGSNQVASMELEFLANYIIELSLLEYNMLRYAPSLIAASATFLANFIVVPTKKPWNSTLRHYTQYKPSDLSSCVKALHQLFIDGGWSNLPAIRDKYSQHKFKFVAKKYCSRSLPPEIFQDHNE